jgi:hypothetical protein
MPSAGAERWFHTLVVMGAALGGCGGKSVEEGHTTTGGDGGAISTAGSSAGSTNNVAGSGGPTSPDECAFDGAFVCQDYVNRLDCRCDSTRPRAASACLSPFDFACADLPCSAPGNELCLATRFVDCYCDPNALKPEDCGAPELLFCDTSRAPFRRCTCHPGPAIYPEQCPDSYCCESLDPLFGCDCSCARIK